MYSLCSKFAFCLFLVKDNKADDDKYDDDVVNEFLEFFMLF